MAPCGRCGNSTRRLTDSVNSPLLTGISTPFTTNLMKMFTKASSGDAEPVARRVALSAAKPGRAHPQHPAFRYAQERATDGRSPLEHALSDGEDFELILTAPPDVAERILLSQEALGLNVPVTRIGRIIRAPAGATDQSNALLMNTSASTIAPLVRSSVMAVTPNVRSSSSCDWNPITVAPSSRTGSAFVNPPNVAPKEADGTAAHVSNEAATVRWNSAAVTVAAAPVSASTERI